MMNDLYHVSVEYGKSYSVRGDLTHDEVMDKFVIPWLNNQVLIVNGTKISPEMSPVLTISRSEKSLSQLMQIVEREETERRQRQTSNGILDLRKRPIKLLAVKKATDVTSNLIEEAGHQPSITSNTMTNSATFNDSRNVFVVYGRNIAVYNAMLAFLRALDLHPLDWTELWTGTGSGAPYIGQILDEAFARATAVIVLLTPDESSQLSESYIRTEDNSEDQGGRQPRPNVLFEAGMAFGRDSNRTILVEVGKVRHFSDISGRFILRFDGSAKSRHDLAQRLENLQCAVRRTDSWLTAGDFTTGVGLE